MLGPSHEKPGEIEMQEFDEDDDGINRKALAESLSELGFTKSHEVSELARLCFRLIPADSPENEDYEERTSNHTRLGGNPDAPANFVWPLRGGKPLAFLGQIQVPDEDVLISFFFDSEQCPVAIHKDDADSCQVYEFPIGDLVPCQPPSNLDPMDRYPERSFNIAPDVMLPDSKSDIFELMEIPESDIDVTRSMEAQQEEGVPYHHAFGYPSIYGGDMEFQCVMIDNGLNPVDAVNANENQNAQLENLFEQTFDWILLAQFDSDPSLNWNWIDNGRLFFWIKVDDFQSGKFDRVLCIPQFDLAEEEMV